MSRDEIVRRLQARVPGFDLDGVPDGTWGWALPVGVLIAITGVFTLLILRVGPRRRRRTGDTGDPDSDDPDSGTGDVTEADLTDSDYADTLDEQLADLH